MMIFKKKKKKKKMSDLNYFIFILYPRVFSVSWSDSKPFGNGTFDSLASVVVVVLELRL